MNIIEKLYGVLQERKYTHGEKSYVASLYEGGADKINSKILEEAQEVADEILAMEQDKDDADVRENLKNEAADLIFHLWVGLSYHDVTPKEVGEILQKRFGISGHDEKASR